MTGRADPAGAALGLLVDLGLGERGLSPHPVALFGSTMAALEERLWADERRRGVAHAVAGVALGSGAGALLGRSTLATTTAVWITTGGHMLATEATNVGDLLDAGDLDGARRALCALVGRDPSALDAAGMARAVVESVAENTVDAVVAPALWGAVGGACGAGAYRAVNTLDAMVGHHSDRYERYGWASARSDDVANWVPARVAAALVALVRPRSAAQIARVVRRDARAHPSPNAGVVESAFAAALDLRLGGTNVYGDRVEHRAALGDGRPPAPDDIARAVTLLRDVSMALAAILTSTAALAVTARILNRCSST